MNELRTPVTSIEDARLVEACNQIRADDFFFVDIVVSVAVAKLKTNQLLPEPLAAYLADALALGRNDPRLAARMLGLCIPERRGQEKESVKLTRSQRAERNLCIAFAIYDDLVLAAQEGVMKSSNDACADVAERIGIPVDTVLKIWKKSRKAKKDGAKSRVNLSIEPPEAPTLRKSKAKK